MAYSSSLPSHQAFSGTAIAPSAIVAQKLMTHSG